jgi:hypothetical protein
LAAWLLALGACRPIDAEVGSGLPPTTDGGADGPSSPCNALAGWRLHYWNAHPGDSSQQIDYLVKVENGTGAPVSLSSLKIRYYLTNEITTSTNIAVFYSDTCCSNKIMFNDKVLTTLQPIPPRPSADAYLEIGFDAAVGSLSSGDTVQVEVGLSDVNFVEVSNQTNDYSYVPAATGTQTDWDNCPGAQCSSVFTSCSMTVYRDDVVVWGAPP